MSKFFLSSLRIAAAAEGSYDEAGFYRRSEARAAFRRARLLGALRRLIPARPAGRLASGGHGDGATVAIAEVVGIRERSGRVRYWLPPLRRRHRSAWMERYLREDPGLLPELPLRRDPRGFLLDEEDASSLVTLSVLAAKGVPRAPARLIEKAQRPPRDRAPESIGSVEESEPFGAVERIPVRLPETSLGRDAELIGGRGQAH